MIYQFRTGFSITKVDAQTVGDELERIRNAHDGKLRTEEVVQWAAEPDSPIHECFTWDNERAANSFRLVEARTLIKSVVIIGDKRSEPKPAYWNVSVAAIKDDDALEDAEPKTERYYQSSAVIADDPREFVSVLNSLLKDMTSALFSIEQLITVAPGSRKMSLKSVRDYVMGARRALTEMVPAKFLK